MGPSPLTGSPKRPLLTTHHDPPPSEPTPLPATLSYSFLWIALRTGVGPLDKTYVP